MCGIFGVYNRSGAPVDPDVLRRMGEIQSHRGPDDRGIRLFSLSAGRAAASDLGPAPAARAGFEGGIGCNRLSILDLSSRGHQPMHDEAGEVFIVFNGEIYNAFDYRRELEAAGFRFRSRSDTEVLLYLYRRYGFEGMLERANGMFALAIVDLRRREMLLARDRLGVKPLYWYEERGTFLFSSEVKSFLVHPAFEPSIDQERLDEYLVFRYCAADRFLLKGVRQVEPGQWLRIGPERRALGTYWTIPDGGGGSAASLDEAVRGLGERLETSVRRQLAADVKVGCQLSGGLDSSLITLEAKRLHRDEIEAFSIVVDDPELSEERWIVAAAARAGVKLHRYRLDAERFLDSLDKAAWHLEEPIGHPNSIGILRLAEGARSEVKVLLSGEGADEVFGGYNRFLYATIEPWLGPWLGVLRRAPGIGGRLARRFARSETGASSWFIAQSGSLDAERLRELRPDARAERAFAERLAMFEESRGSLVANCLKYELRTYLVDLLVRQDKMTMAHSIENRVPYLDHELVEFVRGLPSAHLVRVAIGRGGVRARSTKRLLKKLAARHFDAGFVYRPKCGFALPLETYYRHPRFAALMEDRLLPGMARRGAVDTRAVERWWRREEPREIAEPLWIAVALELWAEQYVDRSGGGAAFPAEGTR